MIVSSEELEGLRSEIDSYEHETKVIRLLVRQSVVDGRPRSQEELQALLSDCTREELLAAQRPDRTVHGFGKVELYLARNPHLFLLLGYDELRIEPGHGLSMLKAIDRAVEEKYGPSPEGYKIDPERKALWEFHLGLRCRDLKTGVWHAYRGFNQVEGSLSFLCGSEVLSWPIRRLLDEGLNALASPEHPAVLILPNLWHPPEHVNKIELVECTRQLLLEVSRHNKDLASLDWRQFEDIVAELLRSRGLAVHVTPRSRDGGRDILARGELLPGEPTTFAVEVKHKEVVGVDDVRSRLYANRHFPALMFATSGRFTAGVIREKKQPDNFLRLLLKDGSAIGAWIQDYGIG